MEAAGGELVKTFPEVGVAVATSNDPNFAASLGKAKAIHSVGVERFLVLPETEAYIADDGPTAVDIGHDLCRWDIRHVKADQAWGTQAHKKTKPANRPAVRTTRQMGSFSLLSKPSPV